MTGEMNRTRVDRWLWAVRVFKTRGDATEACRGGHVRVNGTTAKPAAMVRIGDRVDVRLRGRDRVFEVLAVIDKRVGAPVAAGCVADRTPATTSDEAPPVFARDRGAGRPTKRDRRQLDRFRS
jgi:ribosome-associated heat shock protein Hsp15